MKLILPIALLASTAAAASCDAEDIVEACLTSEQAKFDNCDTTDYDCLCAAQQAIATCFNNCPDDSRAGDARGQVQIHCENASLFGSSATTPTKSGSASTDSSAEPTSTSDSDSDSDSDSQSAEDEDSEDDDGAAAGLALNMGGLVLGVAGVMAALV
ncbi:hypothetical protein VUR80DRAFT_9883 [Thermomyces stellatus]